MTLSQFNAFADGDGNLVLQSDTGDTTVIVKDFYSSVLSQKTWFIADGTEAPQFLGVWVGSQGSQSSSTYSQQIAALREADAIKNGVSLNSIGEQGGTIADPSRTILPGSPNEQYQFNGVTTLNETVSGGVLDVASSENDQATYTYVSTPTTASFFTPTYATASSSGGTYFLPVNNSVIDLSGGANGQYNDYNGELISNVDDSAGNQIGIDLTLPAHTNVVQTGTRTTIVNISANTGVTHETQSIT